MSSERWERNPPQNWLELVDLVHVGGASPRRLSYYKEYEVRLMKSLKPQPHLLLLHDWPVAPEGINTAHPRRPEMEIVEALCPSFVCCGHHHRSADMMVGKSRVIALNLIHHKQDYTNRISSGWAAIFTWDGVTLELHQTWPSK